MTKNDLSFLKIICGCPMDPPKEECVIAPYRKACQKDTFVELPHGVDKTLKRELLAAHENCLDKRSGKRTYETRYLYARQLSPAQIAEIKASLTQRERTVSGYLRSGDSSKKIAEKLNIRQKTVNNHRDSIRLKLGVSNPVELVWETLNLEL